MLEKTFVTFPQKNIPDANPIFPSPFKYGVSTSSYQVEANVPPSNWSLWEKQLDRFGNPRAPPNAIKCDGFNRFEQDLQLAQSIGCKFYRLSFSWSRLNPSPGQFNHDILQKYRSWLIKIRELGMEPLLVLWHFEHPAWLEERGSFLSEEFVQRYTEYVEFVINGVSDVCTFYHTVNEPIGFVVSSLIGDVFPPGKGSLRQIADGMANLMQCHANAYAIIHRHNPTSRVSFAKNVVPTVPKHKWSLLESIIAYYMNYYNRVAFDVFKTGKIQFLWYTREVSNIIGALDFISLNHYYCIFTTLNPKEWSKVNTTPDDIDVGNNAERGRVPFCSYGDSFLPASDMGWGMLPGSLAAITEWVHVTYNLENNQPIFITEHGAADAEDTKRQWFLKESLFHLSTLAKRGVPISGYIHWTLFDNYEWADGTTKRFGLFETDYNTLERKPRESAKLFQHYAQLQNNRPEF